MGGESPVAELYNSDGYQLSVYSGVVTPTNTPALMIAGSDGTNSRYIAIDSSGRPILVGAGTAGTPVGGVVSIQGVSGGQVVPTSVTGTVTISGTVTANIGTTGGLALDTSVNGILVAQNSTTSGQTGPLIQGAVTTAAPSYTTAKTSPLSLTTAGALRIDGSAVTQPVSGTVTANAGSGNFAVVQATAANLNATVVASGNFNNASVSATAASPPASATYMGGSVTTSAPTYTTGQMNALSLTTAGLLRIDGSGVTQPVSGTVTANIGTSGSLALDTSVNGILVSQGSTTSGEKGPLIQGAVTTAAPTYTTAQTSPLSLTTAGALRIDGSGVTQPVSGTVTANAGTGNFTVVQSTSSNLRAQTASEATTATSTGTVAALMGGAVTTASPTYTTGQMDPLSLTTAGALRVDGSGVTQPVSGTVTANAGTGTFTVAGTVTSNQGTANTLANAWPVKVTDGTNTMPTGDVVGRAIFEKITDGTNTATVKAASTAAVAADPALVVTVSPNNSVNIAHADSTASGTLNALNATASIALASYESVGMFLAAGSLIGTIVPELSFDGGTNWVSTYFDDPATNNKVSSIVFSLSNVATTRTIVGAGGASNVRVRVSVFTSGTATCTLRVTDVEDPSVMYSGATGASTQPPSAAQIGGWDGSTFRVPAVKAASTAAVAGDQALVVAVSPNNTIPVSISSTGNGMNILDNQATIHSNSTITTSGSQIISTNFYGVQQINLIVNVKNAPTGTTPTLKYTITEVDPGDNTTTFGNTSSTQTISAAGVFTTNLATTTSGSFIVSWTISGASASFTGVYSTVVCKATPATQAINSSPTNTTPGISYGDIALSAIVSNTALNRTTYTEQTVNFTGSVVSSSASDASAGTGARTITITYYDSTGSGPFTEVATLNGTTAVNLVSTNHCFIEKIAVTTVGSGASNAGTITLKTGAAGAGTTVGTIAINDNLTFWAHHYIPSGKTNNLTSFSVTINGGGAIFFIKALPIGVANAVEAQITDFVREAPQAPTFPRNYGTAIKTVGPARLQAYVTTEANTSLTYRAAFDYYDQ